MFRRYPQFGRTPNRVEHLPSVGSAAETHTVRQGRGLGLQARFNATHQTMIQPLLEGNTAAVVGSTWPGYQSPFGWH